MRTRALFLELTPVLVTQCLLEDPVGETRVGDSDPVPERLGPLPAVIDPPVDGRIDPAHEERCHRGDPRDVQLPVRRCA